jgi:hypothetical protein
MSRHRKQKRDAGNQGQLAEKRHRLLDANLPHVHRLIREAKAAGDPDPVVVVAELGDFQGRQCAIALLRGRMGLPPDEANRRVDKAIRRSPSPDRVPAFVFTLTPAEAEWMLPHTSPTAARSVPRALNGLRPGQYLVVCVAGKGNTYMGIELPPAPEAN